METITKRGPATLAMPYMPPIRPVYVGRLTSGTVFAIIRIAPEKMPDAPNPAIARPIMNAGELGAAPQRALPTSKMNMAPI